MRQCHVVAGRCHQLQRSAPEPEPGYSLAVVPAWIFTSLLIVAAFTDIDHWIIPDRISYGGLVAGLVLAAIPPVASARLNPLALGQGTSLPAEATWTWTGGEKVNGKWQKDAVAQQWKLKIANNKVSSRSQWSRQEPTTG